MIKQKTGICQRCDDTRTVPLIAGLCKFHYWNSRAALKGKKEPKPRKPVKKVSDKRSKENKIYTGKRIIFLAEHKICEAKLEGCTIKSTDVHHIRGRCGELFLDETHWKALCRSCHKFVEENSEMAKELGLSESRLNQ